MVAQVLSDDPDQGMLAELKGSVMCSTGDDKAWPPGVRDIDGEELFPVAREGVGVIARFWAVNAEDGSCSFGSVAGVNKSALRTPSAARGARGGVGDTYDP